MDGNRRLVLLAGLWAALVFQPAIAQEDFDLDRIPRIAPESPAQSVPDVGTGRQSKIFSENVFGLTGYRNNLAVPLPSTPVTDAAARTSLDSTFHRDWAEGLSASLSDRFDLSWQNDIDLPSHRSINNELREAYLTWEPLERSYFEAGRINLRNGIALGFNPTDFFKTRSSVSQASLDPSALRNNRLGAFMLHGQSLWEDGSMGFAFAPKLADPSPLSFVDASGFGARSDLTNGQDRLLVSLSQDVWDLSPQALLYHEANLTRWGLNLSHPIGQSVIAYAEWAGGRQSSEIAEAVAFAKRTGTIPPAAQVLSNFDDGTHFRNDLATGLSWTSSAKVTVNLEYHEHEAGLSRQDWCHWFASGSGGTAQTDATLWYTRSYAADQQDPMSRRQLFLRVDWTDALISHLELTAFAFVNLYDGSSLAQVAASYDLSDHWSMAAFVLGSLGTARSERGSLPQADSVTLQLTRFF